MAYCAQGTVLSKKERTVSVGRRPRRPRSQTCKFSEHAHVHVISFFSRPFTGVGAVVVLCCRCLIFCRERGISRLNYFMPSLDDHSTSEGLRASGRPRQRATNHKNTSLDVECGPTRGASGASAKSPSRLAACLTKVVFDISRPRTRQRPLRTMCPFRMRLQIGQLTKQPPSLKAAERKRLHRGRPYQSSAC